MTYKKNYKCKITCAFKNNMDHNLVLLLFLFTFLNTKQTPRPPLPHKVYVLELQMKRGGVMDEVVPHALPHFTIFGP